MTHLKLAEASIVLENLHDKKSKITESNNVAYAAKPIKLIALTCK